MLSDVISTMRIGRPHSARIEWYAPWGMRFPEVPGSRFLVVLQGACLLLLEDREPVQLGAGDVLFLPRGREHRLVSDLGLPTEKMDCLSFPRGRGGFTAPSHIGAVPHLIYSEGFARPESSSSGIPPFGATSVGDTSRGGPSCVTVGGSYFAGLSRPHPLLTELPSVIHLPAWVGKRSELPLAVGLLGRELGTNRPGGDTVIPHLLDMLVVYILRAYLEEHASGGGTGGGFAEALRDPAVHEAIRAVHHDPAHPWTVAKLGLRAGLSRAAFARRFTSLVGRTPLAYVTWWRMTVAARLLREEEAPISAIADKVGYSSQFAFAHAFKREFGRPPGRYRETALSDPPGEALDEHAGHFGSRS